MLNEATGNSFTEFEGFWSWFIIRVLQNQEAFSSLWSLSWHFYSVYSTEYRNCTCANFWGFKINLNRADILVLFAGQDMLHTENTVKYIFIFIGEAV